MLPAARRSFLRGGTIEMLTLARELGIGRATLYRWWGSRDELLGEVIASLGVANLRRCEDDTGTPPGPRRVIDVHDLHLRRIQSSESLRTFLRSEPEVAFRVLLKHDGRVHQAVTDALADFIRRQEAEASWHAPLGADALADVVTQISEAFLYGDLIAGREPDATTPSVVLGLMFGIHRERPDRHRSGR